jgi:hypothetical protein
MQTAAKTTDIKSNDQPVKVVPVHSRVEGPFTITTWSDGRVTASADATNMEFGPPVKIDWETQTMEVFPHGEAEYPTAHNR